MKKYFIVAFAFILSACAISQKESTLELPIPTSTTVDGKTLNIQGEGFFIGRKFGLTAKVYKFAFYTDKKYTSAEEILNSPATKHLYIRYTYTLDRDLIVEGLRDAYSANCSRNCEDTKDALRQYTNACTSQKIGDIVEITFKKDGVELYNHKSPKGKIFIASPDFSYNLLSVFIGPKVKDPELRRTFVGH